uniref:Glycylpeptide N-tetradecanoyltransferase n=1 Tax=Ciona savignyi TaxID=51511 RepID=H2YR95_CIOSA
MSEVNGLDSVLNHGDEAKRIVKPKDAATNVDSSESLSTSMKKKKKSKDVHEEEKDALNVKAVQSALAVLEQESIAKEQIKQWKFWDTQPVPKLNEDVKDIGAIEPDKVHVREEPYSLPVEFEWDTVDLGNPNQLEEVYKLLNENYVEDDDNMFRFDYSAGFLQWSLRPPGWIQDWHCGVRVKKSKKLVGFISAIPALIKVYDRHQRMVEINFLCVHKKLRTKRVAPVLIREITRRVNRRGIFQAVYTAGVVLPKPVAKCRYYHRSLNPRKLVEVKFSHLGRNQTMQRLVKLMRLPEEPQIRGIRPLKPCDIPQCHKLMANYLAKFNLSPVFTEEEFSHFFLPRKDIVESYVVTNQQGEVTDMASFFILSSSIMHHPDHQMLYAAYSFYNVAVAHTQKELMKDMLIFAKKLGFDVFNALDLMDNHSFLKDLKFGMGDGNLHYYLYNYKCPDIPENNVGLVLQ